MYYNYTDEQKHFLSVTDAMLKDDFSVEEIVEFWQSEDQEQVDGILGSLTLTESVDFSNPDLAVVCERFGLGWISKGVQRLFQGLRRVNPKTGNPRITGSKPPSRVKQVTDKVKTKVKQGADKVKTGVNKLPPGAKGGLAVAGGSLALIGAKDVLDATKDAMSGGDKKGDDKKKPPTGPGAQPGDVYSTKTTPVAGPKGPAWWKSYEKAAPYHSSKRYHDNIRKK
tara:strand:+ start:407 stop:1081 length:675 start_codon:yes stop_codon:yes gene_type:complete